MNNEKKPNSYKREMDVNLNLYLDSFNDHDNTNAILNRETTRYTDGAEKIINKVQNEILEKKREAEIDKALANRDKEKFMVLTSDHWKDAL
jgi:uncharacterized protein YpiB (UPF0302 family)